MIRRPPRSTRVRSSAASDVYKRQNDYKKLVNSACPSPGCCPEIATGNTLAAITEAIGMSMTGNSTMAALSSDLMHLAQTAGKKIMELHKNNIKPSDIMTKDALINAMRVV